jgi:hypothetical protein
MERKTRNLPLFKDKLNVSIQKFINRKGNALVEHGTVIEYNKRMNMTRMLPITHGFDGGVDIKYDLDEDPDVERVVIHSHNKQGPMPSVEDIQTAENLKASVSVIVSDTQGSVALFGKGDYENIKTMASQGRFSAEFELDHMIDDLDEDFDLEFE